jgi:catechol 2,3-dioxygenase
MTKRLIAHLAHIEVLTPTLEESLRFYQDVMGLQVAGRHDRSVYLRGWGEWSHHSLQLTESDTTGLGHIAWRAAGTAELEEAVQRLEEVRAGEGWFTDSVGHGPAYRYRGPGGHLHEIFWEQERYQAPEDQRSTFPNRPQRYVPRGVAPRQIDHVTVATQDPWGDAHWYRDVLGYTFTEYMAIGEKGDTPVFTMVTTNEKSHDLGLVKDHSDARGRLHHFAFWVDSRDELLRSADVLINAGVPIEYGPGRHGMGEQDYLYVREPSGVRVEVNTGGYRLYIPDWEPVKWTPGQGSDTFYRNVVMPDSMLEASPAETAVASAESRMVEDWTATTAGS